MSLALNEQQLKRFVNGKAKEFHIQPQQMYALYGLEQLLIKINHSRFKDQFVLKGSYLLSAVYGLDNRSTRDLDTTIRGVTLNDDYVQELIDFLVAPENDGQPIFEVRQIRTIREQFDYDGYNIRLNFLNGKSRFPIEIDMTTGETLLPLVEKQEIPLMFQEGTVNLASYPLEQILADKLYTTLAYGQVDDTNTRVKDLYDLHFLTQINQTIDYEQVYTAIEKTKKQRKVFMPVSEYFEIVGRLEQSEFQQNQWEKYRANFVYAEDVSFSEVMASVAKMTNDISLFEPRE
ncbi:nucleotidyl transferase AbiEii/AbiGii toxin family protein [Vagococcus acidifermentans]|nr:nucleotidyl transferase AbiEii/AbiGii toxin family protein [Vagococcus acidifermentans]